MITIQLTFFLRIHNVISGYTVDGELFGPQLKISRTVLKTDEVLYYQCLNSFKFQRYKSGRADNVGEKTFLLNACAREIFIFISNLGGKNYLLFKTIAL